MELRLRLRLWNFYNEAELGHNPPSTFESTIVIHRTDNGFHSCSNSSTGVCSERLGVLLQKRPDILSLRRSDTLSGPDKLLDLAVHPNFVEVPPPKDPTNDVFRVTYPVSAA